MMKIRLIILIYSLNLNKALISLNNKKIKTCSVGIMMASRPKVNQKKAHLIRRTKRLKLSKMTTWMMKRQRGRIQHLIITGFVRKHSSFQRRQRLKISKKQSVLTG
jgi:hypothetical protein